MKTQRRRTRVKICCIGSIQEAWLAIEYGASAVGLVSHMPSGPGVIPDELIARIARSVPPAVSGFLLTCEQDADAIIRQQREARTGTIQICDQLDFESYEKLRRALPGIALVQVVHVGGSESLEEALAVAAYVDAVLLDSGNQKLAVKELGGTGRTHDWSISRWIREALDGVPVFLAGGLNAGNVAEAIRQVEPFGIDVCSGVRTEGKLDEAKLSAFFRSVESA
ncbi:MAG TPA: phosphoribosylanthranilate isomerase [Pyrinomonadaceae bacterium]|jgi:phosphoribosylanthranilate isomerase|nr:phosphoribosylanthranilate isomerase [Pyrinomonadaceae bacterium]